MWIEIALIVLHNNVEVLIVLLSCWKSSQNFHCELSLEHWDNLYFPVFVFWVLENFFYSNYLIISFQLGPENFAKSALANQT